MPGPVGPESRPLWQDKSANNGRDHQVWHLELLFFGFKTKCWYAG